MKLIVGLGNPGPAYTRTRHNIGRRIVESLARQEKIAWRERKSLHCHLAELPQKNGPYLLALLNSYMNESGRVVKLLVDHFEINFKSDLLIIADDVALPLGKLRLRARGSDGGHQGLRSIEQALGKQDYARLRVGIGAESPLEIPLEKYVLTSFESGEEGRLKKIIQRAVESCLRWVSEPITKAMDRTNKPSS